MVLKRERLKAAGEEAVVEIKMRAVLMVEATDCVHDVVAVVAAVLEEVVVVCVCECASVVVAYTCARAHVL